MAKDENLDVFKNAPEEKAPVVTAGRKLRIGFIGTGGIANSHMKAYKQFEDKFFCGVPHRAYRRPGLPIRRSAWHERR